MAVNNQTHFIGRMTADPELRMTQSGKEVCSFSLGVDRGWGERKHAIFPRFVAFGATAKYISGLKKGTEISVDCEYDVRDFEQNGEKRQSHEFTVTDAKAHRSAKPAGVESVEGASAPAPAFADTGTPQFETIGKDDDLPF